MPSPGSVVLFSGALAGSGVARNTVHLANALARRGVPVEVICLRDGPLADELRGPGITCLGRGTGPRGLALAAAMPALHKRLRAIEPSVVVSMGNHAHLAIWAALRGLPDIPRIYRISNDIDHLDQDPLRQRLRRIGLSLVAADATRLLCVSAAIAARGPLRRDRRDRQVDVLPNGVDAAAVRARAAMDANHPWVDDGRPFVVAVGRVHRQKNYERLIEALKLVQATRPGLRLLILGAVARKRRSLLEDKARALGLGGLVRFEGEVASPFPIMTRASAYVLPSLWEGASNSLLEALACGIPVVASRTAGNAAEVLAEGRYGVLADPMDPTDLALAILRQTKAETCVPVGDRAEAFRLDAVIARLCGIIASARSEHDENQMQAGPSGHFVPLSEGSRGTNTEYMK